MELLVCVKQVADLEDMKIDQDSGKVKDNTPLVLNPYDKNALETAVQIKEKLGGTITALSIGSDKAKAVLKEAVSVGADKAILISDDAFEGSDSLASSEILAAAINKLGKFDLIICGNQSTDTNSGQVSSQLSVKLDMPQATSVSKIEEISENAVVVNRDTDQGVEVVDIKLPAVLSVIDTINEPRLATIKSKLAANKAKIEVLNAEDLEIDVNVVGAHSATKVLKTFVPQKREAGMKIKEETEKDSVLVLIEKLVEEKVI